ncbi:MAG: TonB-dependent receptor [Candidatus Pseudobacter hemicellulosilyticus]|uniref:TonB-dependent receptor n=1 Tax=Candidatus Pseudobacter hemicellulosilyticus TaxID=3121375 RepID=A0AAJ5WS41_9BACT|nr:MAG: TonB-dependent receptor [Pseudobacter sp.]
MHKFLSLTGKGLLPLLFLLLSSIARSQDSTAAITGIVSDNNGKPIPSVTVFAKNSLGRKTFITATDSLGRFAFDRVPVQGVYSFDFSSQGYQTRTLTGYQVRYGVPNTVYISLAIDEKGLDEVMVVGYGTQKKVNLTGAVNQISGDQLRDRPATNITAMLQGAMPNLNIRMASGTPGQMGSFNIRGATSVNTSNNTVVTGEPLVLVDGIPGTLDRLSPEEIQSITVLKDAASAAIYGSRGGLGVILVTTKNGKAGKTVVRYNNTFGWATPTVNTDFITTGYDWMKLNDQALAHVGGYSGYTDRDYEELLARRNDKTEDPSRPWITIQNRNGRDQYVYYGNYDWWNIMFTKYQPLQTHNISMSGGNEKVNFMLNGNLKQMDGIMRMHTDKYTSGTIRAKIGAQLYPWLKVTNNTNFYHSNYNYYGREGGGTANFTHINVHASPAYAPVNPDGTATYITGLNNYDIGDGIFAMLIGGNQKGQDRKYEMTTINEATITPFKDMNIVANYSFNMYTDPSYYRQAAAKYSLEPGVVAVATKYNIDKLAESQQFNQRHVVNIYADYFKSFARSHNIKLLAGFNQEFTRRKKISAGRANLSSETLNDINLGTGEQTVGGGSDELALQGLFYRLNYDYKGKYLLETNGRFDGSSRFPENDRWGFFPSVSAAWRVSEEAFFEPLRGVVSEFKLRGSVGVLGNQTIPTDLLNAIYPYVPTMNPGTMSYILGGERAKYYSAPGAVSSSLTWEKVTSYNGGVDIGLLNNRLTLSFDKYLRVTSDILTLGSPLPGVFGADEPLVNAASIETKGFEFTAGWKDKKVLAGKPFNYSVNVVLSDNYAVVSKFDNPTNIITSMYVGKKIGEIWGYTTDGFFKTDAEAKTYPINQVFLNKVRTDNNIPIRAGDLRWLDLNGDGTISSGKGTLDDPGDQRVIGNTTPRYQYAINLNASWNNIDLSVFFQGLGKMNWYPGSNADRFWGPYSRPYFSFLPVDFEKDVYSSTNTDAYFPNLLAYVALNANNELRATNNRYLQNLAYLRLKNLTVGYTLPQQLTRRFKIDRFRMFFSGENLLTWTKLRTDYIDPEQAMANGDARVYPFSKNYSFGFDISF